MAEFDVGRVEILRVETGKAVGFFKTPNQKVAELDWKDSTHRPIDLAGDVGSPIGPIQLTNALLNENESSVVSYRRPLEQSLIGSIA